MIKYEKDFITLPEKFYQRTKAQDFSSPKLICFNSDLAENFLGLDLGDKSDDDLAKYFSGQVSHSGLKPIAFAYAGHQFGHHVSQLGDGRAMLLGEVKAKNNRLYDLHLKGSGPTPFSRGGDGYSALGPVIREYLVSEAMHCLKVPTTRALAAVKTGDQVSRNSLQNGGVFTRVALGHIRIGTFEYFAFRNDTDALKTLSDYTINRFYPELQDDDSPYLSLIEKCADNWARLIAKWMSLGFIHGVMNTDNMSVSGETIDFGPCAFMDKFSFSKVFSSIDRNGRYAYNNQINIGKWNLYKFASCFISLLAQTPEKAIEILEPKLENLGHLYEKYWHQEMGYKFGIKNATIEHQKLFNSFLHILEANELDFTNSFVALHEDPTHFKNFPGFEEFDLLWKKYRNSDYLELMSETNPYYIPRNHLVEEAIEAAYRDDFSIFNELNEAFKTPFVKNEKYMQEPTPDKEVRETFCGT